MPDDIKLVTVAEPFEIGKANTGLAVLHIPDYGPGKFLRGFFDDCMPIATIVEPRGVAEHGVAYRGKPGLDISFLNYPFRQRPEKAEKKAEKEDRKTAMFSKYGRDEPIVGVSSPAYSDFLKLYTKAINEGYNVEFVDGSFKHKGEFCNGLREGKKITLNRQVGAAQLAYNLAHELNEDESVDKHRYICSSAREELYKIGASRETLGAAGEAERFLRTRFDW